MSRLGIREIAFFVVLVIIPLVIVMKVLKPHKLETSRLNDEISVWKDKVSYMGAMKAPAFAEVQKSVEMLKLAQDTVLTRLPYASENNQIMGKLSQLTRLHSLRTVNYKPFSQEEIVPNEGSLRPDQIRLVRQRAAYDLEGSFKNVYQFLQAVERLPQIIHVENLQCEPARGPSAEKGEIKVTFHITLFFRMDPAEEKTDG